ncbi:amylo-alpha-1,6-glucosidase [Thioalkalivibrio sp. ALE11]|uniref:amylo-alpha-1,6-glucosidase n=1 Tax=Thioalkalivibrio sp. ALE11 TaxID=1265494 RepID=UPI00035CDA8C|nr:amylo-alpha-1,6-glucosidase [Thioalkalivibrio sp. ALE11]
MRPAADIRLGRAICGDLAQAERREWWLGNGRGAYAAGTVAATLTRRYHGLLIAPVEPPLGRRLLATRAEATLLVDGDAIPLFTNRWADGAVDPEGHRWLESFHLDGRMPVWRYALGSLVLECRIWLMPGEDTARMAWRADPGPGREKTPLQLRVALLVNDRDHHQSTPSDAPEPAVHAAGGELRVEHPGHTWMGAVADGVWQTVTPQWIEAFDLPLERERGLPDRDRHLHVASVVLPLEPGRWTGLGVAREAVPEADTGGALDAFRAADDGEVAHWPRAAPEIVTAPAWIRRLALATRDYRFARPLPDGSEGASVIAGYPWFGDWGRDTLIALPGLTLATGHPDEARRILETFGCFLDRGMLPNVFPGAGDRPEYNTADAALWYVHAWWCYWRETGDFRAVARALPGLASIIDHYTAGTRFGIGVDPADGLLRAGEPGIQLTWMDARIGDRVITPRTGKPVELNALWHNALAAMAELAEAAGQEGEDYQHHAGNVAGAFVRFDRPRGGLLDVVDGPNGDEPAVRPNQILAVSLPFSPLDPRAQARVVAETGRHLLTSSGLRSLAPCEAGYRGRYRGGVEERDGAYHQGPVWGWLLGPWALAEYRITGDADAARARLLPVGDHLTDAGLGHVSEIFDGDPPHTPRGAPAQAWSAACVLEAWWRLERVTSGRAPGPYQSPVPNHEGG